MTGQGHLVRHAFFARELKTSADDPRWLQLRRPERDREPAECLEPADDGLERLPGRPSASEHPRPFHSPVALLELISPRPDAAVHAYRQFVDDGRVLLSRAVVAKQRG